MNTQELHQLKEYYAKQCGINATIALSTLRELIEYAERTSSAGSAVVMSDEHRAVIEEATQVLESAAAYNRSKGRTVLQYTQQDRADRLRAILAAAAPLYAAAQAQTAAVQAEVKLEDIEQYRMQMAGISTAALGYWKEGDSIHPDYDTVALRDVAKLYAKYAAMYQSSLKGCSSDPANCVNNQGYGCPCSTTGDAAIREKGNG